MCQVKVMRTLLQPPQPGGKCLVGEDWVDSDAFLTDHEPGLGISIWCHPEPRVTEVFPGVFFISDTPIYAPPSTSLRDGGVPRPRTARRTRRVCRTPTTVMVGGGVWVRAQAHVGRGFSDRGRNRSPGRPHFSGTDRGAWVLPSPYSCQIQQPHRMPSVKPQ